MVVNQDFSRVTRPPYPRLNLEKQTHVRYNIRISRIVVVEGRQRLFLEEVKARTGLSYDQLASELRLNGRTVRDWRREKYHMSLEAAQRLSLISSVPMPEIVEIRPEHWSCKKAASLGGIARLRKYGPPGTPEGRRKGGRISQELRRQHPERHFAAVNRKGILKPALSPLLAEFVGIALGDGGITRYQTTVSLNSSTDSEYIEHILYLFDVLFGLSAFVKYRAGNSCYIKASSVELSEFLVSIGLCVGDKIRNQVDIPSWIFDNKEEYMKGCIRELIDTDGNVARKNYHAKTLAMQISFRNESQPLLWSARKILMQLGFAPSKITKSHHIHLTRKEDIKKYIIDIGFSNPKHVHRIQNLYKQFGRGARVVEGSRLLSG